MKIFYDDYTKILHIGSTMIGLGGYCNWALRYYKNKECKFIYVRIGKLALRWNTWEI